MQKCLGTIGNLKNKPLVEAIFELRWSVADTADQFWDMMPGLYYSKVRDKYPFIENLPASQVPVPLAGNSVRHRFRQTEGGWPLTQLGLGVLTVNDTSGYTVWGEFLPRIVAAATALTEIYEEAVPFKRAELRYINAVPYSSDDEPFAEFVKRKLHTSLTLPDLFDGEDITRAVDNANITAQVHLKCPAGVAEIIIAPGQVELQPAILFHLNVRSHDADAPKDLVQLGTWADDAHRVIDAWFLSFCEGDLLESFKG